MGARASKKQRRVPKEESIRTDTAKPRKKVTALTLQAYFLGTDYKQGRPCSIKGYEEAFYTNGDTEIATLRHRNTEIQVWQFALDLRIKTRIAVIEDVFESQDKDNSGYLDKPELKVALQALGFIVTEDELYAATKYYGGLKRTCISYDDFVSVVARKDAEDLCLFVFTDEQRFRSVTNPDMKLAHVWTTLVKDEYGELGPGLYATSRPPDQWENQSAVIINNSWLGEAIAVEYGEDLRKPPSSSALKQLILDSAGRSSAAFCIPILCGRQAANDCRDYMGRGWNAYGEYLLPWRDVWVIDLVWGGLESKVTTLPNRGNGLLADCNGKDALVSILRARIAWRDGRFGNHDLDTAALSHQLACIRTARNQLNLAGPLFRRALSAREQLLGWTDIRTLSSATSLGLLLEKCGEFQDSEDVLRRVLIHRTKKLGASHPEAIASLGNLALLLRRCRKNKEFEELLDRARTVCHGIVDQAHTNALECLASASSLFLNCGLHEEHADMVNKAANAEMKRLVAREQMLLEPVEEQLRILEMSQVVPETPFPSAPSKKQTGHVESPKQIKKGAEEMRQVKVSGSKPSRQRKTSQKELRAQKVRSS